MHHYCICKTLEIPLYKVLHHGNLKKLCEFYIVYKPDLSLSSCRNALEILLNIIRISLLRNSLLRCKVQQEVALTLNIVSANGLQFSFSFNQTKNVQFSSVHSQCRKLRKSISFYRASGRIRMNAARLYPDYSFVDKHVRWLTTLLYCFQSNPYLYKHALQ